MEFIRAFGISVLGLEYFFHLQLTLVIYTYLLNPGHSLIINSCLSSKHNTISLWVAAKLNPQISPRRVPDILYPIFCFQQAFWLNIRHSMSPLKNIYIFRRIFLRQKLKNRAKIEKSVKIKNWQMNFFGFFFSFFG